MAKGTGGAGLAGALPEEFAWHVRGVCDNGKRVSIGSIELRLEASKTLGDGGHVIVRKEDVLTVILGSKGRRARGSVAPGRGCAEGSDKVLNAIGKASR